MCFGIFTLSSIFCSGNILLIPLFQPLLNLENRFEVPRLGRLVLGT